MDFKKYDEPPVKHMISVIYEDEIERLNVKIERLRNGLEHIVEIYDHHVKTYDYVPSNVYLMAKIARETLKEKDNG